MTLRHELHSEHIYRLLEQTLIPPTTVQELDPDFIESATIRLNSTVGSPSETYIINSEFTSADLKRLPSAEESQRIRRYFLTTAAEGYEKSLGTRWARKWQPDESIGQLISPAWMNPVIAQSLYGVDILAYIDGKLWRQVPGVDGTMFEQNVDVKFAQDVATHLPGQTLDLEASPMLILVGSHVRLQFTHGVQAARGMMQAAGIILGALSIQAMAMNMRPLIISHFNNSALNKLVNADGIDRAVVSVFSLARNNLDKASLVENKSMVGKMGHE